MIISEFHFFQVQRKLFLRDAMKLGQPLFGIPPESFQAINVHLAAGKSFPVIHPQMPIPAAHQGIIDVKLVRIDDRSSPHQAKGHLQQPAGHDVFDHVYPNHAVSLQNAEYRHFIGGSTTSFALASAAKAALIQLNRTAQKVPGVLSRSQDRVPQQIVRSQGRGITDFTLNRRPKGADLQFQQLDQPSPGFQRAMQFVYPSAGKIMKGVMASFTAIFPACDPIDFIASTLCAKNMPFLPAVFSKIKTSLILCKYNAFKVLRFHVHQYNILYLVQKVL